MEKKNWKGERQNSRSKDHLYLNHNFGKKSKYGNSEKKKKTIETVKA